MNCSCIVFFDRKVRLFNPETNQDTKTVTKFDYVVHVNILLSKNYQKYVQQGG